MIVVDSSVWIDHLNGRRTPQTAQLGRILDDEDLPIIVGDVIMYEVLCGLQRARAASEVKAMLERRLMVSMLGFELVYRRRELPGPARERHHDQGRRHLHRDLLHRERSGAPDLRSGFRADARSPRAQAGAGRLILSDARGPASGGTPFPRPALRGALLPDVPDERPVAVHVAFLVKADARLRAPARDTSGPWPRRRRPR